MTESTSSPLPISKEKLQSLREKYRQEKRALQEESDGELYDPPLLTSEYIGRHQLSESFVASHEYLRLHYRTLSEKYGNDCWLIISESGVVMHSHDHKETLDVFYDNDEYPGNAILTKVGEKKSSGWKYTKLCTF